MRLEHQADGTYLASQIINNKLRLSEGNTSDEAWHGLIEMLDSDFRERLEQLKREVAA